jgi:hypothetical protein
MRSELRDSAYGRLRLALNRAFRLRRIDDVKGQFHDSDTPSPLAPG